MFQPRGPKPYPNIQPGCLTDFDYFACTYCIYLQLDGGYGRVGKKGGSVGGGGGGDNSTQQFQLKCQTSFELKILFGSGCFYAHQLNSRQLQRI